MHRVIRGYERHQGAHVIEVDFDLPERCTCPKCGHEAEANIRYKNDVLVIRDLDLFGQPSGCPLVETPPNGSVRAARAGDPPRTGA